MKSITRKLTQFLSAAALCFSLPACGFVYRNTVGIFSSDEQAHTFSSPATTPSDERASVSIKETAPANLVPEGQPSTKVEVLWEIPKDPVDGFVIKYGLTKSDLNFERRVLASELERFEDPQFGYVYRYFLTGVPEDKSIFVSLTAYNGDRLSRPTDVFEVKADKKY